MLKLALLKRLKSFVDAVLQRRRDTSHWYLPSQASERDKRSLRFRGTGSRTYRLLTVLRSDGAPLSDFTTSSTELFTQVVTAAELRSRKRFPVLIRA